MTENKETIKAEIPSYLLEVLDQHIQKFNRKAKKFGLAPVVVEKEKEILKEFSFPSQNPYRGVWDKSSFYGADGTLYYKAKYLVTPITVTFEPLRIKGGWKVLGTIERTETEYNVINGKVEDIGDYKKYDLQYCDHCQTHRYRKMVFIIENENGERQVVGRQCVKDYLGVSVSAAIFSCDIYNNLQACLNEVCDEEEDENDGRGYGMSRHNSGPSTLLTTTLIIHVLKTDKWSFRGSKNWDEFSHFLPTSHKVWGLYVDIFLTKGKKAFTPEEIDEILSKENQELAEKYVEEAQKEYPESSLESLNQSFEYNFALMLNSGTILDKNFKLFAGMMGYRISKEHENTSEKKDPKNSKKYGAVGDKCKGVCLNIKMTKNIEGYYGDSLLVTGYFENSEDQFVCFFSGDPNFLYDENDNLKEQIKASFTIKNHQDRGYGMQTLITRLRLTK